MADKTFKIVFEIEGGGEIAARTFPGEALLDAARRANVAIDAPCGGNGTCGKCRVRLLAGETGAAENDRGRIGDGPSRFISPEEYAGGFRTACSVRALSDLRVFISRGALAYRKNIKVSDLGVFREQRIFAGLRGEMADLGLGNDLGLETIRLQLSPPEIGDAMADRERLVRGIAAALGVPETKIAVPLDVLRKLPRILREAGFNVECVIRGEAGGHQILNVYPVLPAGTDAAGDALAGAGGQLGTPCIAGLAIDIGTTTVSMLLVDLETGDMISTGSAGNGQIRYGADVITRIIESTRPGGLERLRAAVTGECTEPLIHGLCEKAGIAPDRIYRVAVAANTTMTHLFLGVPAEHLRLEPYVPAFFEGRDIRGKDIGMGVNPEAEVLIAPSIGSYVGGDITAGVFSSMIFRKETPSLFIDLGTNGELVFGSAEFLFSCACSAGPAFEGGDISCGMRATDGAIEACGINADTMEPDAAIVGNAAGQKPAGLCGSGLIDLIGELFRCGIINSRGKFIREGRRIKHDEYGVGRYIAAFAEETDTGREVALTETDIDNFIRAKGAIFSAIRTMLAAVEYPVDAIEDVYVAGGIGSGINMSAAIRIGMFPNLPLEKFHYIGNSSMLGAYAMTSSRKATEMVTGIAGGITYLELSSYPGYMDEFVAACFLPHTDASLFQLSE
ncbi:MAG: ASKHA domain-containing protein [Spirochaetaceae bacterium]|jgi:uncharacterized 2Fe-2S/4Fe-4S cluster protein (DUF4445 family)|nr:ASKHA domain-containing protein [Spirochaetaceae bacterium]